MIRAAKVCITMMLVFVASSASAADTDQWGIFGELAKRQWTTTSEPQSRTTRFQWEHPGKSLIARHGLYSRLSVSGDQFADTVQRLVLDDSTGLINSTYIYTDLRPPLHTVIRLEANLTATETFRDGSGIERRNIYRLEGPRTSSIERQELRAGRWVTLGITRREGVTLEEFASNRRSWLEQQTRNIESRERWQAEESRRLAEVEARVAADTAAANQIIQSGFAAATTDVAAALADRQREQERFLSRRREAELGAREGTGRGASAAPSSAGAQAGASLARRRLYSWCRAVSVARDRVVYMSAVGSREVTVDEQQQWRSAMEREFEQQLTGPHGGVTCDIDDDADFSYTRGSAASDNPAQVLWSPH